MNEHIPLTTINCRICLRCDKELSKCLSLFETYNGCSISAKVNWIAKVNIQEGDGMPDMICPDCLLQLENALAFIKKCEASNKILLCNVLLSQTTARKAEASNESGQIPEESIKVELSGDPIEQPTAEPVEEPVENNIEYSDTEERLEETEELDEVETLETSERPVRKSRAIDLQLICDDCQESFKSKCRLRVHWKKVHQPEKLICPNCKRIFKTYKTLNLHKKSNSRTCLAATKVLIEGQGKSRVFHCKECTYKSKRIKDIDTHMVTHTGDRRFLCKDCPKTFTQYSSLQSHREISHKDYRLDTTCHLCGKHIQGRTKYYRHMQSHKELNIQCKVCHQLFKTQRYLDLHMPRHSGVKTYSCEVCAASFYTYSEVYNHRKKVHQKSSLQCDMCDYKLHSRTALKVHKSKHTATNIICLFCGQFSENAESLAIHQMRHFDRKVQCPHCEKKYHNKKSLSRHICKYHRCTMLVEKREGPVMAKKGEGLKLTVTKIKQESPPTTKDEIVLLMPPPTIIFKPKDLLKPGGQMS